MKKYIVFVTILFCALFPPLAKESTITMPSNVWAWLLLLFGAISILFLYSSRLNIYIKLLAVYLYISCFFSQLPHVSFFCYFSVILCISFYLLCRYLKKEELEFQLTLFPALLLLQFVYFIVQTLNKDAVFNSLDTQNITFGTLGNPTILSTFIVCITGLLCLKQKWFIIPVIILALLSKSISSVIALGAGLIFYVIFKVKKPLLCISLTLAIFGGICLYSYDEVPEDFDKGGRIGVWKRGIKMSQHHWVKGWGMGTWKYLFPLNSKGVDYEWWEMDKKKGHHVQRYWQIGEHTGTWLKWMRAHNDWLQDWFEIGAIGMVLFLGFIGVLIWRFIWAEKSEALVILASGLIAIGINMIRMFPTKMIQAVPIIIFTIAYFRKVSERRGGAV